MENEIEFFEYLRKKRDVEDIIDFGENPQESIDMLSKFSKRGYIESEKGFYELTEKGENRLLELKSKFKSTTINFHGNHNNVVGNSENSKINQEIISQVPREERKWYQNFLSSLISALGVKITLTILWGLFIGTFTFNYFNQFNPILFGEVTFNNVIFILGCVFAWLTWYASKNVKEMDPAFLSI